MPKHRQNEELFKDGDKTIRFIADNSFGKAVNEFGIDISIIFNELASGKLPVSDIENIMICGMSDIDGEPIKESERSDIAGDLISRYGLQQCHQLAWVLLSHIMLGEKKSFKIDVNQRREAMAANLIPGHSANSMKAGLLWAAIWISSGLLACMTSKLFNQLITFLTG